MGGNAVADDCSVTTNDARTLVLLGRTGNGKSATGNSILGRKEFKWKSSSNGVTATSELKSTRLDNGLLIDVIDTPGLFDFSGEPEYVGKEIVKCMELAVNGIHAVLLVLSVLTRFSREELAAIQSFQDFFGEKIRDYMIVVFTGGDELEDSGESLDDYLGNDCPESLKETIKMCDNRVVLFDNKTKDPKKKVRQLYQLLLLVNLVLEKNNGVPYTNELFKEMKALKENSLIGDPKDMVNGPALKSYEEFFKELSENVILKMTDVTHKYLEHWATERAERLAAEKRAKAAQERSEDEIRELREKFERATLEAEEQSKKQGCYIL